MFVVTVLPIDVSGLIVSLYGTLSEDGRIDEINSRLIDLEASVEEIQADIGSILNRLDHLANLVAYHDDYSRLKNYLRQYTDYLDRGVEIEESWLNTVLGHGSDGLDHTLENFDSFISGETLSTSVLLSYEGVLTEDYSRDSPSYYTKLHEFVDFILSLQVSGYAMFIAAKKLKNQPYDYIQQRLDEQISAEEDMVVAVLSSWPSGSWGLLKSQSGCPVNTCFEWKTGSRYQTTVGDDNSWAQIHHFLPLQSQKLVDTYVVWFFFRQEVYETGMTQNFCMKDSAGGEGDWPPGTYCIFTGSEGCPSGFRCGYVYWDDHSSYHYGNHNSRTGSLPGGSYTENTKIWYACRDDGSADNEIELPARNPFYLMRYGDQCQKVWLFIYVYIYIYLDLSLVR